MAEISLLIGAPHHVSTWKRETLRTLLETEVETSFSAAEALEGLRACEREPRGDVIVKVVVQDTVPVSYEGPADADPDTEAAEQEARRILDDVPDESRGQVLINHLRHYFSEHAQGGQPVEFYLLTEKPGAKGSRDMTVDTGIIRLSQNTIDYDFVSPHAA